jgi:hypothetical protein
VEEDAGRRRGEKQAIDTTREAAVITDPSRGHGSGTLPLLCLIFLSFQFAARISCCTSPHNSSQWTSALGHHLASVRIVGKDITLEFAFPHCAFETQALVKAEIKSARSSYNTF